MSYCACARKFPVTAKAMNECPKCLRSVKELMLEEINYFGSKIESLFDAIKHGDDEHRAWLKEAIEKHFADLPVPPARSGEGIGQ